MRGHCEDWGSAIRAPVQPCSATESHARLNFSSLFTYQDLGHFQVGS